MKRLILIILLSVPLAAQTLIFHEGFVSGHTEVAGSSIDPISTLLRADLKMDGDDLASLRGRFWVEMKHFSSDNSYRDGHMHEVNEIERFSSASFILEGVEKTGEQDIYILNGQMHFHGVKRSFSARAEIGQDRDSVVIRAVSKIYFSEYGLQMPCLAFFCVRDQVDIFAKALFFKE